MINSDADPLSRQCVGRWVRPRGADGYWELAGGKVDTGKTKEKKKARKRARDWQTISEDTQCS